MQRIANPWTSVRLRVQPPFKHSNFLLNLSTIVAGIAQLVEHDLAKVGVASSNLVSRSKHIC